jgi:hypothetical protein
MLMTKEETVHQGMSDRLIVVPSLVPVPVPVPVLKGPKSGGGHSTHYCQFYHLSTN